MSSEAGSAAKRSTARRTRAATAPAVRPVHGQHVGEAVVAQHARALTALGDAVGDAEQDVTRVERDRLLVQLQVVHHAEQGLRVGGRLDGAVLTQAQRERVAGADDLQQGAAVLLGPQLPVEERKEAAAGALVEDRRVEAFEDRGAAETLAGQQAQRVPGQAR